MQASLIGIITRTGMYSGTYKLQVNANYFEPLTKRGFSAIIISYCDPNLENTLSLCDGFLLPGGDDIDPQYYGEENTGLTKDVDYFIDELDKKVLIHAKKYNKPVLGICRGIQSMAAFYGGSLYQDIPSANLKHEVKEKCHVVTTIQNHEFAKNFKPTFITNSYHHQAVKDVPNGFVVIFKSEEVIEGMIHETSPFLGVQWHPERLDTIESNLIFDKFVEWVKEYHEKR